MHGPAVVGEAERAGVGQLGHLGQRVAGEAAGDRGEEADRDARLAPRGLAQRAQHGRIVDDRVGVRHRDDGDEAAGRRGARAGVEVLLVLLARHAQVHVRVDEAGEHVAALAVEHLGALRRGERAGLGQLGDAAAAHEHVERPVDALARVEHVRAAHEQVGGRLLAVDERRRRAGMLGRVHAVTSARSGRGAPGEQLVEDRHADDDAGRDLLADHRLGRVDHLGGQLDAAVDRARVHQHLAGAEPAAVDLVARGVLAQAGDERLGHALLLHAQGVDDIGLVEAVQRVADLAAELLHPARDQRRRPADGHLGAEHRERLDVRARDARVQDVADDPDVRAVERTEALAQRVDVEQRLGRVLVLAVAGVDDRGRAPARDQARRRRRAACGRRSGRAGRPRASGPCP